MQEQHQSGFLKLPLVCPEVGTKWALTLGVCPSQEGLWE